MHYELTNSLSLWQQGQGFGRDDLLSTPVAGKDDAMPE
jgi:hypothetical protein